MNLLNDQSTQYIAIALVSYMGGLLSGIFVSRFIDRDGKMLHMNNVVLIVVTCIWAVSMMVDIISPSYETSPLVHGLMGAIVGFFYRPKLGGDQK